MKNPTVLTLFLLCAASPLPAAADLSAAPAPAAETPLGPAAALLESGDWRGARRRALAQLPAHKKSPALWVLLGRTYIPSGRHGKALRRFNKALARDPHHAPAYLWRGRAYEAMGKIDEAANEYQAALKADPKLEEAKSAWTRLKDQASAPQE